MTARVEKPSRLETSSTCGVYHVRIACIILLYCALQRSSHNKILLLNSDKTHNTLMMFQMPVLLQKGLIVGSTSALWYRVVKRFDSLFYYCSSDAFWWLRVTA